MFPPGVVDVYLCNLMPKDLDISWSVAMKKWVEGYIQEARRNSPNGYMYGKVGGTLITIHLSYYLFVIEVFWFDSSFILHLHMLIDHLGLHNESSKAQLHSLDTIFYSYHNETNLERNQLRIPGCFFTLSLVFIVIFVCNKYYNEWPLLFSINFLVYLLV